MKKCYIYTRVSTETQVEGYSLDAQKERLRQYAEYRELEIVNEYCDAGHHGANIQEPVPTIVESLDAYPNLLKSTEPIKPQGTGRRNRFHNFNERDYDYDKLEKWLLSTSPS